MFLKKRRALPWICCVLAALLLACGLVILDASRQNAENREILSSEVSQYLPDESEDSFWDEAIPQSESPMFPYDEFETGFIAGETSATPLPPFVGFGLLAAGTVLAVLFLFVMIQKRPYLGPETEIFLLFLCILLIWKYLDSPVFFIGSVWILFPDVIRAAFLWILFSVLLISARGIWSWMRTGFVPEWSAGHRLGMLVSGSSGHQSRYLIFQLIWIILSLLGCILLFMSAQQHLFRLLPGTGFLSAAALSLYCFKKRTQDIEHLTEQIRHLHQGSSIDVCDGAWKAEEEMLIDLNRQKDEAVRTAVTSERFKVDLISNVSHDLRTPLTAILGYGELLLKEHLSADGKMQLAELNRKAGYMRDLVESLFELTKVSSGVLESKKETIDLLKLLEQTIGLFDDALKEKKLSVRRHYPADSLPILTDGARMHQVFANLIGNAIKYTLPGTRIHLEVKKTSLGCTVRMVNISSYEMDFDSTEILQRFVRGDKSRTSRGSGLGLAIAQTYTESVGGTFEVKIDGEQFSAIVTLPKN
ncbi:HAMP domain-containing sensor histidine kinase [Lachnospiraceae bacterium 46-15]